MVPSSGTAKQPEPGTDWSTKIHKCVTFTAYVYLLRVSILIGMFLVGFPLLARFSSATPLFENLLVLDTWNIFCVMLIAFMLAWSLLFTARVILLNGKERFGIDQGLTSDIIRPWHILLAGLTVFPLIIFTILEKSKTGEGGSWVTWLIAAFSGFAVAYVIAFGALIISIILAPRYSQRASERFEVPFPFMRRILRWADEIQLFPAGVPEKLAESTKKIPEDLRSGYFDPHTGFLYPGQWLMLTLLLFSIGIYFLIGILKEARLGETFPVPALGYVLLLMLVLNWVLSLSAFFLDRYRVPVLLPLILLFFLGNHAPQSDHYYSVQHGAALQAVSPEAVLASHASKHLLGRNPNGEVVVVATAGGGIQAAAWTAQVLTGLQAQCQSELGLDFAGSITAISSVSGGAVGTMFFANQYQSARGKLGFQLSANELHKVVEMAETSALDEIAWAIVYTDSARVIFPYRKNSAEDKLQDRGQVLEDTWRSAGKVYANLSNWRQGALEGWRPAIIFNSTIAETGEPLLLTTSDMDTGNDSPSRNTFAGLYPDSDLAVVTAVRLAATFPYVTPASRALSDHPEYHIVDGGYYDNYGIDGLLSWLDEALRNTAPGKRPDVLVIQIRSFPKDTIAAARNKGWFFQAYAPLDALLSVRSTAQLVRDRDALARFQQRWAAEDKVNINFATFEFPGTDAPLSWKMTEQQKGAILNEWNNQVHSPDPHSDWNKVRAFFTAKETVETQAAGKPR